MKQVKESGEKEEERRAFLGKIRKFFSKDYPLVLIGALFSAAVAFSILSYKYRKGSEEISLIRNDVLGERAGSVSAVATVSASSDDSLLQASGEGQEDVHKQTGFEPSRIIYPININNADSATLDLLPGVGSSIARKIIDYRGTHGPFKSIEDLLNVSGIGEKKFDQLKDLVTVGE